MLRKLTEHPVVRRVTSHIPPGQFFRYLLVGVWNTGFNYALFALFTYVLSRRWPKYGYLPANALSSIISITVAFLAYKRFVFKTKGNYLREWLRCLAVYGSNFAIVTLALPCIVFLIREFTSLDRKAPYLAAAILTCFTVAYSFVGHRKFSFRRPAPKEPGSPVSPAFSANSGEL